MQLPSEATQLCELGLNRLDLITKALRRATYPLAGSLGHATDPLGDELVDRVDLLGTELYHDLEVIADRLTSMLELGRAHLQTTVETCASDAYGPLDDTVERLRLTSGQVAGNENTSTEANLGDCGKGYQERVSEHGFYAPATTKGV